MHKKIDRSLAVNFPEGRIALVWGAIGIEKPIGSVVIEGEDDHFTMVFNSVASGGLDADKFCFCHVVALLGEVVKFLVRWCRLTLGSVRTFDVSGRFSVGLSLSASSRSVLALSSPDIMYYKR